jgi:hypothetical protein
MMIAVAVLAALLVAGLECRRLKRLSDKYRYLAWGYSGNVRMRLQDLTRAKLQLTRLKASPNADPVRLDELGVYIELTQALIAANANLVQIYEHAADHPWETPPRSAETGKGVEDAPIPKRILTNPLPPEPYRPSGL